MKTRQGYYNIFVKTCAEHASRVAIRQYEDGNYKCYTYSELYGVCEYISQNLQLLECNRGIIGIISKQNFIIPSVIAAAHKLCSTFMFIDIAQDLNKIVDIIDFAVILKIDYEKNIPSEILNKKLDKTITIFNWSIGIYNLAARVKSEVSLEHSFIAMTSGSSGDPKFVQVPTNCMQPNIDDLTSMFQISPNDVIYFSTPLTFDPSMVEILLACTNGASLLIAPLNCVSFAQNQEHSVSFWQTTPSQFFQNSTVSIRNKILSSNSSLRILAFGGEPFYTVKKLKELKHAHNKTKVFVLYGVTEMSCWACVTEIDFDQMSDKEIPLGNCLSETHLILKQDNEKRCQKIILASETRKCNILNKSKDNEKHYKVNSFQYIDTGDTGENLNGTIYYRGRTDDVIKRFGNRVSLHLIESTVMQFQNIKTCSCVWLQKLQILVLYFSSMGVNCQELSDKLKNSLDEKHWPDKIIRVDSIPTNSHGKISKQIIANYYAKNDKMTLKEIFLKELNLALAKNFTYDQVKMKRFIELGGSSFLAVSMCNRLSLAYPHFSKKILPYLLSHQHTIGEIIAFGEKDSLNDVNIRKIIKRPKTTESTGSSNKKLNLGLSKIINFEIFWSHNTGKCVDASPSLSKAKDKVYVTVGSHSGNIYIIDGITGLLEGTISVKSRIEAAVLCFNHPVDQTPCGVVGAYNGTVVCFNIEKCDIIWKINIGSMVKSKASYWNNVIYLASYDGNVRCIDVLTGQIKRETNIEYKAISADLVLAKNEYILLGTLSGVCAAVHAETNIVVWRDKLSSPIFGSPAIYDDKYVVFIEVNGGIHCRTIKEGVKIWTYRVSEGNIYSSLSIRKLGNSEWQMIFGCHDHYVYNIIVKNSQPSIHWKAQLTSAVYSTPCAVDEKYVLAVSTDGNIYLLDVEKGEILSKYQLPDEIFSSPVVYGDNIYLGCRNDLIYGIKMKPHCDSK